jgi:hypothetical protein
MVTPMAHNMSQVYTPECNRHHIKLPGPEANWSHIVFGPGPLVIAIFITTTGRSLYTQVKLVLTAEWMVQSSEHMKYLRRTVLPRPAGNDSHKQ